MFIGPDCFASGVKWQETAKLDGKGTRTARVGQTFLSAQHVPD
jgi:hypothetical protein